jgi:hypothetical protein
MSEALAWALSLELSISRGFGLLVVMRSLAVFTGERRLLGPAECTYSVVISN